MWGVCVWMCACGSMCGDQLAAGDVNSAAITDYGKLYTWGADNKGQLGLGCAPVAEKAMFDSWDDLSNFMLPPRPGASGANQVCVCVCVCVCACVCLCLCVCVCRCLHDIHTLSLSLTRTHTHVYTRTHTCLVLILLFPHVQTLSLSHTLTQMHI